MSTFEIYFRIIEPKSFSLLKEKTNLMTHSLINLADRQNIRIFNNIRANIFFQLIEDSEIKYD